MTVEVDGLETQVTVTFIEWKRKAKGTQRIYLCDANGAALLDVAADLRSRDVTFTAYICWSGFKNQDTSAHLAILGGEDLGAKVFAAGREAVNKQLVQRAQERRAQAVEDWKSEQSYPYTAEPKTVPEKVIRQDVRHRRHRSHPRLGQNGRRATPVQYAADEGGG